MLTVGVLGPLEVRRDGRPLPVPSGKTTELLIRLALDAGQVVTAERLIEDLWGDDAAATARNTLQSKVSQLRRALDDPAIVGGGRGGYTLELDAGRVDALEVVGLAAAAAAARRAGDAAAALEAATEGLELFRATSWPMPATAPGSIPTGRVWTRSGSACSRTGRPPASTSAPAAR